MKIANFEYLKTRLYQEVISETIEVKPVGQCLKRYLNSCSMEKEVLRKNYLCKKDLEKIYNGTDLFRNYQKIFDTVLPKYMMLFLLDEDSIWEKRSNSPLNLYKNIKNPLIYKKIKTTDKNKLLLPENFETNILFIEIYSKKLANFLQEKTPNIFDRGSYNIVYFSILALILENIENTNIINIDTLYNFMTVLQEENSIKQMKIFSYYEIINNQNKDYPTLPILREILICPKRTLEAFFSNINIKNKF